MTITESKEMLVNNNVKLLFSELYGNNNLRIENQGTRYTNLLDRFVTYNFIGMVE
jgi:hypothetical protein